MPGAQDIVFHSKRDGATAAYRQRAQHDAHAQRLGNVDEATHFVTPYPSPDDRHVVFASACEGHQPDLGRPQRRLGPPAPDGRPGARLLPGLVAVGRPHRVRAG